jgi:hypothetical protein
MCPDGSSLSKVFRLLVGLPAVSYTKAGQSSVMQATSSQNAQRPITPQEVASYITELDEEISHKTAKINRLNGVVIEIAMRGETTSTIEELTRVIVDRRALRSELRRKQAMRVTMAQIDAGLAQPASNARFMDIVSRAGVTLERQNPDASNDRVDAAMERLRQGLDSSSAASERMAEAIDVRESSQEEMSIEEEVRAAFAAANSAKINATMAAVPVVPVAAPRASMAAPPKGVVVNTHTPQQGYTAPRPGGGHVRAPSTALAVYSSPSQQPPVQSPGLSGFDSV